jgi:hypothetical protein
VSEEFPRREAPRVILRVHQGGRVTVCHTPPRVSSSCFSFPRPKAEGTTSFRNPGGGTHLGAKLPFAV